MPLPLSGSEHAGRLARQLCDKLGADFHVAVAPPPQGSTGAPPRLRTSFIDLGVYTQRRCFRVVGSRKLGGSHQPPLVPNLELSSQRFQKLPRFDQSERRSLNEWLCASLVVPEPTVPCSARDGVRELPLTLNIGSAEGGAQLRVAQPRVARAAPRHALGASSSTCGGAVASSAAEPGGVELATSHEHSTLSVDNLVGFAIQPESQATGAKTPLQIGASTAGESLATCPTECELPDRMLDRMFDRMTPSEWLSRVSPITPHPLLDLGGIENHPFVRASCRGKGFPPAPFGALGKWAEAVMGRWPRAAASGVGIRDWRYARSEYPSERLLHLSASGTRHCFCVGREHRSQHVMVSVDLLTGELSRLSPPPPPLTHPSNPPL